MYSDSSSATSDGDSSEEEDQVSRARKWASFCCGQHDHCYYLRHALRVDLSPLRECIASAHKPPEFAVIPVREEHSVRDVLHFMEDYITNYARSLLEHPHLRVLGVCHAYARKRKVLSPDAGVQELGCFSLFHRGFYRHAVLAVVDLDLFVAFVLGTMPRAGQWSPVRCLHADSLSMIFRSYCSW